MRGVAPALPVDSVDTAPALTPEARAIIAAALRGQYLMEPILLEAVVDETGVPDSAGAYVLGGGTARFVVEPLVPRLRFSPAVRRGLPVRARVRLPLADRGGPEVRQPSPPDSMPRLLNGPEVEAALVRLYPRLYRDAEVTGEVTIAVEVDEAGVPDLTTVEVLNVALEELSSRCHPRRRADALPPGPARRAGGAPSILDQWPGGSIPSRNVRAAIWMVCR